MTGMVASIGWPFSPWHEPQTCNFASMASPACPASGGGEKKASLQLPHLSGPQRAEALRRNFGSPQGLGEREERGIERLVGQLEGAVMVGERDFGAAIDQRLHGLGWVHVLVAHEPARLVGSDRQNSQSDRSVALA